jgi:hypothetical protein
MSRLHHAPGAWRRGRGFGHRDPSLCALDQPWRSREMGGIGRRHTLSDPQFSLWVMTEYWDRTGH